MSQPPVRLFSKMRKESMVFTTKKTTRNRQFYTWLFDRFLTLVENGSSISKLVLRFLRTVLHIRIGYLNFFS
jgi:hypothetical protein